MGNFFSKQGFYYLALFKYDDKYTIHGLWPNYDDGTYPSFCKNVQFDIKQLDSIKQKLLEYWELPKDHDKIEDEFWNHEFRKHGTCMFIQMTELEYFSKAIELYETYVVSGHLDISKYHHNGKYMIPFDLDFKLI